jgi:transposase
MPCAPSASVLRPVSWLLGYGLKAKGWPVTCIDARHAKAALSLKVDKTDANGALGLAQIMRVGWFREVAVKGHDCQALRALLVARAQIVSQITTLKNRVRGILKTFGHVLPKKLRACARDMAAPKPSEDRAASAISTAKRTMRPVASTE